MTVPDFPDRQTPEAGEIFLDHVGWYVPDMDQASAALERLGFRLSPYTEHSHEEPDGSRTPSGTANRCAMARLGYLEFLAHVPGSDAPLAKQLLDGLKRYEGLHLIAFTCADAEAERIRLSDAGFDPLPVAHLRRPLVTDNGAQAMSEFSVIRLKPGVMKEGRVQMLSQDTPDVVWQPSLIARENFIDALSGVLVCTQDPAEAADRFARLTGRKAAERTGYIVLELDRGRVVFADPRMCGRMINGMVPPSDPFIAACVMRSADLTATDRFLARQGVVIGGTVGGALCVDAQDAMGAYLIVHGADTAWPAP